MCKPLSICSAVILFFVFIVIGCKKSDTTTLSISKPDFYYKNPQGAVINNAIIELPYSPTYRVIDPLYPSITNTATFQVNSPAPNLRWAIFDSVTNKKLDQSSTSGTFEYGIANMGTKILKLYSYKNQWDAVPADSSSKIVRVSNLKKLKSIVVDSFYSGGLFIPSNAKVEIFVRIYKRKENGERSDKVYYETPHLQNIEHLATNVQIPVDTLIVIASKTNFLEDDPYFFVLYEVYQTIKNEALSNQYGPVRSGLFISQPSDKSQLLESRRYSEIDHHNMMTITTSYTYMSGK